MIKSIQMVEPWGLDLSKWWNHNDWIYPHGGTMMITKIYPNGETLRIRSIQMVEP